MYRIGLDMGLPEFGVQRAICEMHQRHDTITMDEIADYIGCSKATVWRACKRLQEAGQLRMIHVENRRFRYELMETVNVRSIRD